MTEFDIDVTINSIVTESVDEVTIKVNVVKKVEGTSTYSTNFGLTSIDSCLISDDNLKRMSVDIIAATDYLILQFIKSGKRYTCSRTKLGKLLTIVAFTYAVEGKLLFDEKVYKYGECGTAINEILDNYDRDIYISSHSNDDGKTVVFNSNIILDLDESTKEEYKNYEKLEYSVRRRIDDVFLNFGSYSASKLGEYVNCIINVEGLIEDGEVNFYNLYLLSQDNNKIQELIKVYPLVKYVFKYI